MDVVWQELSSGWPNFDPLIRVVVRLVAAAVLGGVLGLERQYEHKTAGLRTHMLVAVGAALFMAAPLLGGVPTANIPRVIQGIAEGIGFVGGGAILKMTDEHRVRGLTTASSIWMAAAVGMACGGGWIAPAAVGTVLALAILYLLGRCEQWFGMPQGH